MWCDDTDRCYWAQHFNTSVCDLVVDLRLISFELINQFLSNLLWWETLLNCAVWYQFQWLDLHWRSVLWKSRNFCTPCFANFSIYLDETRYAAMTCWSVQVHADFVVTAAWLIFISREGTMVILQRNHIYKIAFERLRANFFQTWHLDTCELISFIHNMVMDTT